MSHSPWFQRQPTLLPGRPLPPAAVYVARSVAGGFFMWMAFALYALFVVRDVGLEPFQLIGVAVVLEAAVVAFEVPTGVLADAVSRRLSVVIGTLLSGAAWALFGLFPTFEGVLAGQFLWGVGYTFSSGAAEAWLSDEVGEDEAARVYPRAAQWRQAARVAGVLAGAGLGLLDARAPWLVGGSGHVALGVLLAFTMTEAGWRPARHAGSAFAEARRIVAVALAEARRLPVVRAALGVSLLIGVSSEMFSSLWGYHLVRGVGLPGGVDEVVLFGGIAVAGELGSLAMIALGRRVSRDGTAHASARVLGVCYLAAVAAGLGLALARSALPAIAGVVVVHWMFSAQDPFFIAWVNRGLSPGTRATVLSTVNQANSVGQVAQGPVSAGLVRFAGVRAALALGALALLPALGLVRTGTGDAPHAPDALDVVEAGETPV